MPVEELDDVVLGVSVYVKEELECADSKIDVLAAESKLEIDSDVEDVTTEVDDTIGGPK
jgi:hypothetical protein